MVDLDDRVLDFILFRKRYLLLARPSGRAAPRNAANSSFWHLRCRAFMLSGGVFKFGTGWGNNLNSNHRGLRSLQAEQHPRRGLPAKQHRGTRPVLGASPLLLLILSAGAHRGTRPWLEQLLSLQCMLGPSGRGPGVRDRIFYFSSREHLDNITISCGATPSDWKVSFPSDTRLVLEQVLCALCKNHLSYEY